LRTRDNDIPKLPELDPKGRFTLDLVVELEAIHKTNMDMLSRYALCSNAAKSFPIGNTKLFLAKVLTSDRKVAESGCKWWQSG